jgi:DNA repair exonuclease SbcCD ATPase subunit
MIHFTTVRWKNVLSTGNAFTEISLDANPSTLIVGENGAGKSTVLDALCFSLYGKPFRKIKKDQLVNSVNGRDVVVEVEFTVGDKNYLIRRGIKPTIFEIIENGKLLDQEAAARDYQEMLEKNILRLTMKSFTQVVILGSSSFVPFMQLSTNNRREVIEDLLDIRVFSSMALLLKDRVAGAREEYNLNERDMTSTSDSILVQEKLRKQQEDHKDEKILERRERISELEQAIDSAMANAQEEQETIAQLTESTEDYDSVIERQRKLLALEKSLTLKKANAKKSIAFYHDNNECPTCTQDIDQAIKCEKIDEKEKTIADIEAALAKLSGEIETCETRRESIERLLRQVNNHQSKLNSIQSDIRTNQKEIAIWQKEIEGLEKETVITSHEEIIKDLQEKYNNLLERKKYLLAQREMHDLAGIILRDSGIKSRIIKQYVPVINTLVNKYLAAMDFFVKFELNETFEEKILSRHRDDFTYDSFSEGEKMRIDLSLLFTWRSIARMKNSVNTNLLILDEVFDASLDANGCDEFLKLIHNVEDTNIFVISHKGDVLQDKFTSTLRFTKQKNFSRMIA